MPASCSGGWVAWRTLHFPIYGTYPALCCKAGCVIFLLCCYPYMLCITGPVIQHAIKPDVLISGIYPLHLTCIPAYEYKSLRDRGSQRMFHCYRSLQGQWFPMCTPLFHTCRDSLHCVNNRNSYDMANGTILALHLQQYGKFHYIDYGLQAYGNHYWTWFLSALHG